MRGPSIYSITCVVAAAAIGCGPSPRDGGGDDTGGGDDGSGPDATEGGGDGCAKGTELVYTIDQFTRQLSQFDPATKTFTDLGTIPCQTLGGPFSMSVSRDATAWVLYDTGELFRVPIGGTACTKTAWASPNNLKVFGMGFSTDQAGGSTEKLYIGGGRSQTEPSFTLAWMNTATLDATPIGQQPQLPEMTGNGNAELWGFFPSPTTARVVQFDKTAGSVVKNHELPSLAGTMTAYAFAHWGGDYWVFLRKNGESATTVYQVKGATGAIASTTLAPGRTIVGAGVSTCAPVVIQ